MNTKILDVNIGFTTGRKNRVHCMKAAQESVQQKEVPTAHQSAYVFDQ